MKQGLFGLGLLAALAAAGPALAQGYTGPLIDAHVHYSHDAWDMLPAEKAVAILRSEARLAKVLVSSSSDDGTQKLYAVAPDLIVPELRPYRSRGELSTWFRDETVIAHLEDRLKRHRYVGIGEFHLYGAAADLPVPRRMVQLAKQYRLFLHAHSDAEAVDRIFAQDPDALVLWAHSGFDRPDAVRAMLAKHKNLWADLAFRSEHARDGKVDPDWGKLFADYPDRFMVGTDTFTPERWYYIAEHAAWSRDWLGSLPPDLAARIAHKNAEALFARTGFGAAQ